MRKSAQFLIMLAAMLAVAPSGHGQLARTDPSHYGRGLDGSGATLEGRGLPDFRTPNPASRVILRQRGDLADAGLPDRRLSQACRRGTFRQVLDHRYVAVLNDKVFGAGIGGRAMLYDPKGVAQENAIYVFVGQGTTNCRVHMMGVWRAG